MPGGGESPSGTGNHQFPGVSHGEGSLVMARAVRVPAVLVMALLVLSAGTVWRSAPASATPGDVYGDPTSTTLENLNYGVESKLGHFGFWVKCTFTAYWVTFGSGFDTGRSNIHVDMVCKTGVAVTDHPLTITMSAGSCVFERYMGNVDDDAFREWSGFMGVSSEVGCGPVTQLCVQEGTGDDIEGTGCYPLPLGAPPSLEPVGDSTGGSCPLGSLLRPFLTAWETVGSAGSWYWRHTVTFRVFDQTTGTLTINGVSGRLHAFIAYTGTNITTPTSYVPSNVDRDNTGASVDVSLERTSGGAFQLFPTVTVTSRSSTQAGAVGSVAAPTVRAAGYYASPSPGASASTQQANSITDVSAVQWSTPVSGSYSNARNYGGHTKLDWCYAAWGSGIYPVGEVDGTPVDDLGTPSGVGTSPPVYVPPNTTPPVIDTDPSDGCDPEATLCVDEGDDPYQPPSVPDPDGGDCSFSITDPATWGGQVICALVSMFKAVIAVLGQLLDFLGGLVAALLEGLAALFVPSADGITDALDGLRDSLETGPLGDWTASFDGAFAGGTPGSCHGPEVDLTTLGVPEVEPLRPFEACSGPMADAAGIVRLVATVTIGLSGGLFIVRMLTSALGIHVPSPGRGGDSA